MKKRRGTKRSGQTLARGWITLNQRGDPVSYGRIFGVYPTKRELLKDDWEVKGDTHVRVLVILA
jgi:hypothetical protein